MNRDSLVMVHVVLIITLVVYPFVNPIKRRKITPKQTYHETSPEKHEIVNEEERGEIINNLFFLVSKDHDLEVHKLGIISM